LSSSKIREIQGENSTISVNFPHTASQQLERISENLRKKSIATIVVTIGKRWLYLDTSAKKRFETTIQRT